MERDDDVLVGERSRREREFLWGNSHRCARTRASSRMGPSCWRARPAAPCSGRSQPVPAASCCRALSTHGTQGVVAWQLLSLSSALRSQELGAASSGTLGCIALPGWRPPTAGAAHGALHQPCRLAHAQQTRPPKPQDACVAVGAALGTPNAPGNGPFFLWGGADAPGYPGFAGYPAICERPVTWLQGGEGIQPGCRWAGRWMSPCRHMLAVYTRWCVQASEAGAADALLAS